MSRHLVDDVAIGWDKLGTDLLDGAPPALIAALTGGAEWPSRTLDKVITPDGSPPVRMAVTDYTADEQDMEWGYLLHPDGIEVISLLHQDIGPLVDWDTDPRAVFSDSPARWTSIAPPPVVPFPRAAATRAAAPATTPPRGLPARPAARR
ncbi:hypothetical protein [Streptomyces sp. ET3-23]|uniref:hypothetical protein n=1 Tax=Streptomyces sp. ET3-23 TaxID=2885643 RepID=UPI002234EFBA